MGALTGRILFLWCLCLALPAAPVQALWYHDGSPVTTASNQQSIAQAVPDGMGGMIIVWEDDRSGTYTEVYVQRLDGLGNAQWAADGVAVCSSPYDQKEPRLVGDGSGGAFVVWTDYRNGISFPTIYGQHVGAAGNVSWASDGVPVCPSILPADQPQVISDGAGGVVVAWRDFRSSIDFDIYAQRLAGDGGEVWVTDGVPVCAAGQDQQKVCMVSDGAGGAVLAWEDFRSSSYWDIFAQRVDPGGTALWAIDGVSLCTGTWNSFSPEIVSDGKGGAVVSWLADYAGNNDIYAQRVSASGTPLWWLCGTPVCSASGNQSAPSMAAAGGGSVVMAWADPRSGNLDVYAQKLDSLGTALWTADGEPVCALPSLQVAPRISSDGADGAVIAWEDLRTIPSDIYAQRLDGAGTALWAADGGLVCSEGSVQLMPVVVHAGSGRFLVAWNDRRSDAGDIYAQFVDGSGRIGYLPPAISAVKDVAGDQGGKLVVQWSKSRLDTLPMAEVSFYSVWRRLPVYSSSSPPEGERFLDPSFMKADFAGTARRSVGGYSWEWLANVPAHFFDSYSLLVTSLSDSMGTDPNWQYFMVTAHTSLPAYYYDSAVDSGYSVDNLSPPAPSPVSGSQKVSPSGLLVHWPANAAPDLSHYAVYRGADEFFIPDVGNLIATPTDTSHFDGSWTWDSGYYYKVSAVDVHGNESAYGLLRPDGVTGVGGAPLKAYFLDQNYPNPFNPATTISFGLAEAGRVSLRVYDARGALVRVLEDRWLRAGARTLLWDGRDDRGRVVASGVYFLKLESGGFSQVRKMVLAK